jgi:cell division protein FtsA
VRNARYSTGMGLLMAGMEQVKRERQAKLQGAGFKEVMEKMKSWFRGNF